MSQTAREPVALHGLRFDVAGMSEQGPRSENQDAFAVEHFARTGIVAVADGMGGERSGRVAADTALQSLVGGDTIRSLEDARRATRQADAAVARAAEQDPARHAGMGCALAFLSLVNGGDGAGWVAAHVGDVRILSRAPDGTLRLETRDHTPAFGKWEAGEISLDEIPDTAGANRLQRAVGRGGEADVAWLPARPGWSWLLISDGVYKVMRLDELAQAMAAFSTSAEAVEAIRKKVEERGPEDNFTAVLVRALGGPPPAPASHEQTPIMDHARSAPPLPAPRRKSGSAVPIVLALLALLMAGAALWFAWQARAAATERAELDLLRQRVDSLSAQVTQLNDPFGPTAVPDTAAAGLAPAPAIQTPQSGVPR